MISNIIKTLCKNILNIYSRKNKNVYSGYFEPVFFKHKYSSSTTDNIRLENNGNIIPVKDMIVEYKCPSCKSINSILLKKFLYKTTLKCNKCREDDEKSSKQSKYVKSSFLEFGKIVKKKRELPKKLNIKEFLEKSNSYFEKEPEEFKSNYYKRVPTEGEFNKLIGKIKIDDFNMDEVIYFPHVLTEHSTKYSPKILYKNKLYLLNNVTYKCDSCSCEFEGRNLKKRSTQYKILCRNCTFCNKTFKIRYTKNIRGEDIRYQSIPELDIIKYCNANSILIQNGPTIQYELNGEKHKYVIDFKINNILVEIKDDHIWHRNELKSGKWEAKEKAAEEYCLLNNLKYKLVMKKDVSSLKDYIVRYYNYS